MKSLHFGEGPWGEFRWEKGIEGVETHTIHSYPDTQCMVYLTWSFYRQTLVNIPYIATMEYLGYINPIIGGLGINKFDTRAQAIEV